jgi:hypothetical protein
MRRQYVLVVAISVRHGRHEIAVSGDERRDCEAMIARMGIFFFLAACLLDSSTCGSTKVVGRATMPSFETLSWAICKIKT